MPGWHSGDCASFVMRNYQGFESLTRLTIFCIQLRSKTQHSNVPESRSREAERKLCDNEISICWIAKQNIGICKQFEGDLEDLNSRPQSDRCQNPFDGRFVYRWITAVLYTAQRCSTHLPPTIIMRQSPSGLWRLPSKQVFTVGPNPTQRSTQKAEFVRLLRNRIRPVRHCENQQDVHLCFGCAQAHGSCQQT